jgi:hypothetical protein
MRITRTAGAVGAAVAAAGMLTGITVATGGPAAGAGGAGGAARACVGTFDSEVDRGPAPPLKVLVTLHADGTAMTSEAAAQASFVPGGADVEFNGPGLGAWREQRGACLLRVKVLSNTIEGRDSGSATIDAALRPARDGATVTGTASLRTSLPEGGGSAASGLRVAGTRITAPITVPGS